jgi:putative intracellular protease/amidase
MSARLVVILTFPGVQPLDAVGPHEVFYGATRAAAASGVKGGYALSVVSADGRPVVTASGLELGSRPLPGSTEPIDTLVIPGGQGSRDASKDLALVACVPGPSSPPPPGCSTARR